MKGLFGVEEYPGTLVFQLQRTTDNQDAWKPILSRPELSPVSLVLSVGLHGGYPVPTQWNVCLDNCSGSTLRYLSLYRFVDAELQRQLTRTYGYQSGNLYRVQASRAEELSRLSVHHSASRSAIRSRLKGGCSQDWLPHYGFHASFPAKNLRGDHCSASAGVS